MNNNKLGYVFILLSAFFFALIAVIGKMVLNIGINVFELLILQYLMSMLFMLAYFAATGIRKLCLDRDKLKILAVQGLIGSSGTTITYYLALERLNAGIASLLLFTYPVLVSLYFMATKTKKITLASNLALLAAFIGSIMAIDVFNIDFARMPLEGLAFGILASAAYAFYNIYADLKLKEFDPPIIIFYTTLVNVIVAIVLHPGFFRFEFMVSPKILLYISVLALVSGILPVTFLYRGIGMIGADKASIVATSELPITLLLSFFVLGERLGLVQIVGIVLILCSVIILKNEGAVEKLLAALKNKK